MTINLSVLWLSQPFLCRRAAKAHLDVSRFAVKRCAPAVGLKIFAGGV